MTRRFLPISIAVAAAASLGISLTSCNEPSCGPGTVQQQQKDGSLKCIPADIQSADIPCDVDAGMVKIVGGICVPAVACDPNSTMTANGICFGTGTVQAACKTPASGKSCIDGTIYDFTTNMKNTKQVDALLYNATDLLGANPMPISQGTVSSDGSGFVFQDFTPPGLMLVVIVIGSQTMGMVPAGTGGQGIVSNAVFHVDGYALQQKDVAGWNFDVTAGGAYIARFFNDPASPASNVRNDETHPQSGVTLTKDGADAMAQYFNDTLTAIDGSLTATGASGTAIVASPVPMGGMFPTFSGMGGGITTWESFPGGSAPNLVIITRFHPKT